MLNITEFIDIISDNIPNLELKRDVAMSRLTSFRIGGPVDCAAYPKTEAELSDLLKLCAEAGIEPVILGAGTNVLAPDAGLRKLVIVLKDALEGMEQISDTGIRVMAGVTMSRAAVFAAGLNLGGLEFAHGIPGTIGGGVYMNAGAYGGEIKDVCTRVRIMEMNGEARWITGEEAAFSYRHSAIEDNPWIVVAAEFELKPTPEEEVWAKMKELIGKRRASMPPLNQFLEDKRASFFKKNNTINRKDNPWSHRELLILYDIVSTNGIWDEKHENIAFWKKEQQFTNTIFLIQDTIWKAKRYYDQNAELCLKEDWRECIKEYDVTIVE